MKEFKKFTPPTVKIKMKRKIVFSNARKLYDMLLNIYFDDYNNITDEEKEKPEETIAEGVKSRRQKVDDKDLFDVP